MDSKRRRAHGEYKIPGGKLVVVDLLIVDERMEEVQVSGDFFLEPASALNEIDSALQGLSVESGTAELTAAVAAVLEPADGYGITAEGVAAAVRRALDAGGETS